MAANDRMSRTNSWTILRLCWLFFVSAFIILCCWLSYAQSGAEAHFLDEGADIPVFVLGYDGVFLPVQLLKNMSHMIRHPTPDTPTSSDGQPKDEQEVIHKCHVTNPVARNREHHLHIHHPTHHLHRRSADVEPQLSSQAHVTETLFVTDYPLYLKFLARNGNNRELALLAMADYYSNVVRSVNRRYESMFVPPFSMTIVPTAFVFADNPLASPWTQTNSVGDRVRSRAALDAFSEFASVAKAQLNFDHAALISGFDLRNDDLSQNLLGIAFTFGVCGPDCVSLTEESFTEQTANTVAHEIGHSLGAEHDGSGNPCSASDFYVMAPTSSLPNTRDKGSHPWIFSTCSLNTVRQFMATSDAACTLSNIAPKSIDIQPYLTEEYGQRVEADTQCRSRFGATSYFCRQNYLTGLGKTFPDMCYNLYCFNPVNSQCTAIPAYDGTTCGNFQWCFKGTCTTNVAAPERQVNCPQLDDPTRNCNIGSCLNPQNTLIYCCATCAQFSPSVPSPPFPSV